MGQSSILVTGGSGFIGGNYVLRAVAAGHRIVNLDKLTYAANPLTLASIQEHPLYVFEHADVCDAAALTRIFATHRPSAVVHFAAESHVDRSILSPGDFLQTNIRGTFELLQAARAHHAALDAEAATAFRFLHISTDEVYGTLATEAPAFDEQTAYAPNSPYAASKAASDHLVRAWHETFGLPTLITNCSNNYGPFQFLEKLIPLMIHNALRGLPLPIYGDGLQVRDWLYVEDHCRAIDAVLSLGTPGGTYNIGGCNQRTNLEVVNAVCALLDELAPAARSYATLLTSVADRPGHDRRYAIDARKLQAELGWVPLETFESGLRRTVEWYLANTAWVDSVTSGAYRTWLETNYAAR